MKYFVIIFFFIVSDEVFAQTSVKPYWGLNINTHLYFEENTGTPAELVPLGLALHTGIVFNKYF
jgi:hypothetical protein